MLIPLKDENPARRFPLTTVLLVLINVAVFYWQVRSGSALIERFALYPQAITGWLARGTVLSVNRLEGIAMHMYLHGGILHLIGNMLSLWIFGNNVEESLGSLRFFLFYSTCGLAAAFTHIAAFPGSAVPVIGASGAVAGVMGAYMLLFPGVRILSLLIVPPPFFLFWGLFRLIRVPALLVLLLWFATQFANGMLSSSLASAASGIAYYAHVGGFVAGLALICIIRKGLHSSEYRLSARG